ncbi:hypothetical protein ACRE_015040 [Hapsidospora chrysogenum ATCC 11550]|uniref:Uncharacterized protein n=1 Tax=Hapsidospora chrysogenum (strain ATCC 11550 / CBS 779.69 / DSM 880 / IAM 14645 / JCM 23072 / IMI 49137) TaxID=857340 RepID=A0A086TE84_HAPC1|nr:hypothetical protein ACRE_015040 [Hapsidospora chrysogenum ATCC 11550]
MGDPPGSSAALDQAKVNVPGRVHCPVGGHSCTRATRTKYQVLSDVMKHGGTSNLDTRGSEPQRQLIDPRTSIERSLSCGASSSRIQLRNGGRRSLHLATARPQGRSN